MAMDADEDVDRRCVNCGEPCCYDIFGSDDHAYARRMCGHCSLQRQQCQQDEDDDDDGDMMTRKGKTDVVCATIVERFVIISAMVMIMPATRIGCVLFATEMLSELQASFAGRQFCR